MLDLEWTVRVCARFLRQMTLILSVSIHQQKHRQIVRHFVLRESSDLGMDQKLLYEKV
jgi:hypothetical protein